MRNESEEQAKDKMFVVVTLVAKCWSFLNLKLDLNQVFISEFTTISCLNDIGLHLSIPRK